MDAGKQILSDEKRIKKAKEEVRLQFTVLGDKESNFIVLDNEDCAKYDGKIVGNSPNLEDYCKCPDHNNRNTENFIRDNGYAFQCKHLIAARLKRFS